MNRRRWVPKQFLGAFKLGHRKNVREFIDDELAHELLDKIERSQYKDLEAIKNLEYITRVNNEYYRNVLRQIQPDDPDRTKHQLHNTKELVSSCFTAYNAKERDLLSKSYAQDVTYSNEPGYDPEDTLIDLIDSGASFLPPRKS